MTPRGGFRSRRCVVYPPGMMTRPVRLAAALFVLGLATSGQLSAPAAAQEAEHVWYRWVFEGHGAGTMPQWERLDGQAAATFPFVEDFEIQIRTRGDVTMARIRDRGAETTTSISCAPNSRQPRKAMMHYHRTSGDGHTIIVALQCSDSRPDVRN